MTAARGAPGRVRRRGRSGTRSRRRAGRDARPEWAATGRGGARPGSDRRDRDRTHALRAARHRDTLDLALTASGGGPPHCKPAVALVPRHAYGPFMQLSWFLRGLAGDTYE